MGDEQCGGCFVQCCVVYVGCGVEWYDKIGNVFLDMQVLFDVVQCDWQCCGVGIGGEGGDQCFVGFVKEMQW